MVGEDGKLSPGSGAEVINSWQHELQPGKSSEVARHLQTLLQAIGLYTGEVNGICSPSLLIALHELQRRVDTNTLSELDALRVSDMEQADRVKILNEKLDQVYKLSRVIGNTRRAFLLVIFATVTTSGLAAITYFVREHIRHQLDVGRTPMDVGRTPMDVGRTPREGVNASSEPLSLPHQEGGRETQNEKLRPLEGLALVLAHSARLLDPNTRTFRDNRLNHHQVSKYLLGNKFECVGQDKESSMVTKGNSYGGDRIFRFAVKGYRSGFLDPNGNGKEKFETTQLRDAINNLLDFERLTDDQIKEWVVFTYRISFEVALVIDKIELTRGGDKKVTNVSYSDDLPPVRISALSAITEDSASQPGGNATENIMYTPIRSRSGRLILESGLANHDLRVPQSLLNLNKPFELLLKTGSRTMSWPIDSSVVAGGLTWQLDRESLYGGGRQMLFLVNGRMESSGSVIEFVPLDDPIVKVLADHIVKGAKDEWDERVLLTKFVQSIAYVGENAADYNRHPIVTLFNNGSDCNNLIILWCALMAARGHDFGIIHLHQKKQSAMSHVVAGIPLSDLPETLQQKGARIVYGFAPVELTSPGHHIGAPIPALFEVVGLSTATRLENDSWQIERKSNMPQ